jgi:hypothetical protein
MRLIDKIHKDEPDLGLSDHHGYSQESASLITYILHVSFFSGLDAIIQLLAGYPEHQPKMTLPEARFTSIDIKYY